MTEAQFERMCALLALMDNRLARIERALCGNVTATVIAGLPIIADAACPPDVIKIVGGIGGKETVVIPLAGKVR